MAARSAPVPACLRLPGPRRRSAPGPPKAIGKGLFSSAFIAMLFTERFVAGRSMNSLVTGLGRQGAEISPATLAGTCAQAGALLAPLEEAITERSRGSWHLHADETTWLYSPAPNGNGPAKWWLWVFLGPDTACFVMDATRSGAVLARHAGIDEETGQLTADDGEGPRQLVISSDFYAVYQSAGKNADGLVNLYCWAHIRSSSGQGTRTPPSCSSGPPRGWSGIRNLYAAHAELTTAWEDAAAPAPREARRRGGQAGGKPARPGTRCSPSSTRPAGSRWLPGLAEPAKKALATLDREWHGLAAHHGSPMISLDNDAAEHALRRPVVTRKNAYGSRNGESAPPRRRIWTVTATAEMAGLNVLTYLTAYFDACGRNGGRPPAGPRTWNGSCPGSPPEDLKAWAKPPAPG